MASKISRIKNIDFAGVLTMHWLLFSYKAKHQFHFHICYVTFSYLQNEEKKIEKKASDRVEK
jgi:hypothetical protein